MKRILIGLAALTLCALTVTQATAGMKVKQLMFRSHSATGNLAAPNAFNDFGTLDAVDSAFAMRVGAPTVVCTTQMIPTEDWGRPEVGTSVSDSGQVFAVVTFSDATGLACESGADSIYVGIQVSNDGANWTHAGTFKGGTIATAADLIPHTSVAGGYQGILSMNGASRARGGPVWMMPIFARTITGRQDLDIFGIHRWRAMRFLVILPDAKGYKIRGSVSYTEQK